MLLLILRTVKLNMDFCYLYRLVVMISGFMRNLSYTVRMQRLLSFNSFVKSFYGTWLLEAWNKLM